MSNEAVGNNIYDRSIVWPEYVRQRVRDTYMYFGSSLVFTAGAAVAAFRSPAMMNLMMKNSWVAILGSMAAMIGSGIVARFVCGFEKIQGLLGVVFEIILLAF
jgi:FtsH-binding integral membrane protein